jgi:peroxiredoxin
MLFDVWSAAATSTPPLPDLGPAPALELPDEVGAVQQVPPAGVAMLLVFIRGHWCPYCRRYLGKLQDNIEKLTDAGRVKLIAISPEPAETSASLVRDLSLTIPILADVDGTAISRYGVRNRFMGFGTTMPHPSVFLIDQHGRIRFRSIDRNYKRRTTIRTLLHAIQCLP